MQHNTHSNTSQNPLDSLPQRRLYHLNHANISFVFTPNTRDFVVKEIPLYEASQSGEHLMLYVRKKGLSTFELIKILSNTLGIKSKHIGYAGLKDKAPTTYQYLTIPKACELNLSQSVQTLEEKNIKILDIKAHCNKLKIGHLRGNEFFVRLKKVTPIEYRKIQNALQTLENEGFPNYFGAQRFGNEGDNFLQAKTIKKNPYDKKLARFLHSSLQSHLFNAWLCKRIEFSKIFAHFSMKEIAKIPEISNLGLNTKALQALYNQTHFFKIFCGDVAKHYPHGKLFHIKEPKEESLRFIKREIIPTGALSGVKLFNAQDIAQKIELPFLDSTLREIGSRRYAWVFVENLKIEYKPQDAQMELFFYLPKGSYATVLLEAIKNSPLTP